MSKKEKTLTDANLPVCASGRVLLVSMQKLRNPAFQRYGADLRKTLMITNVVKQARKFYQLGSDVPIDCSCGRSDSVFNLPTRNNEEDKVAVDDVKTCTADGKTNSTNSTRPLSTQAPVSPHRKRCRKTKVKPGYTELSVVEFHGNSHQNSGCLERSVKSGMVQSRDQHNRQCLEICSGYLPGEIIHLSNNGNGSMHQKSVPLKLAVAPSIISRYFHLQLDDTPPIKKRRLSYLREPNGICITAKVC